MIAVYKSLNPQKPSFLRKIFTRKEINYNLRIKDILSKKKDLPSKKVHLM